MAKTGFFWDERCFWHTGGHYALLTEVEGLVQPLAAGGSPESPESKRRVKNLIDVTGLATELDCTGAPAATREDLERVHPASYLNAFKAASDSGGGELGYHVPFLSGGYEIAAQSAGLVKGALLSVLEGTHTNAYALSRPPGHHCLPDAPNGYCLLANIAVAIEAARAAGLANRFAVVDWDVHHGNGTEAIFLDRDDVLTVSIHQEHNYPRDTGAIEDRGIGAGSGYNLNIPLPPGAGHETYLEAMERIIIPSLESFNPDVIIIACGFDASGVDVLSRMLCSAETYRAMTEMVMESARKLCDGRLVMAHEGGYSEMYVPFCAHAVLSEMSGSEIEAADPLTERLGAQQPNERMVAFYSSLIDEMVAFFDQ